MKKAFVKTENYARFAAGVKAVEQRGAAEAGMMLVHGQPGYGKSHIVYRWAEEAGAVYLRANVDWTPKYFLVELCKALNIDGRGTAQALFERCLRVLVERQCPIIIDEAEFTLSSNAAVLEKVRDFSDRAEVTVILIGMEQIQRSIARHKQISSRIAQVVEFGPCTGSDVALACTQLCDYQLSPGMTAEVLRLSGGRMREVLNILANIERIAATNGLSGQLDVPQFAGVALTHDWQSRTAKTVKARKTLLETGGFIPCQRAGRNATSAGRTLRQRAWSVMRMADHFTVDNLMQTVCDGDEGNAGDNLRNYCRALFRAGILGRTARTRAYFLRDEANTGPLAPAYNRAEKCVTDRNTGKTYPLEAAHA